MTTMRERARAWLVSRGLEETTPAGEGDEDTLTALLDAVERETRIDDAGICEYVANHSSVEEVSAGATECRTAILRARGEVWIADAIVEGTWDWRGYLPKGGEGE